MTVLGAYSSPAKFWEQGHRFDACGINALFAKGTSLSEIIDRAREEGADVYAEFPTLRGDRARTEFPDVVPIGADGLPIPPTKRFLGACPSAPHFRFAMQRDLRRLVRSTPLAGVWLDYLHFHCDFELPDPPLDQSCFCDRCLAEFMRCMGVAPQGRTTQEKAAWILSEAGEMWTDWKCGVVTGIAARAKQLLDEERPGSKLGVFSPPWTDEEYGGSIRSIMGVDIDRLHAFVDVFSPMIYHVKCGRPVAWVAEYTHWLVEKVRRLNETRKRRVEVWPIVEAHGASPGDLETALSSALEQGAAGVLFFALPHVVDDTKKLDAVRRVYQEALTSRAPRELSGR